jgi:hypothetical protein
MSEDVPVNALYAGKATPFVDSPRMASQKEPIALGENGPASYPARQHDQRNHHGDQQESVGGFPNQNVSDGHCSVGLRIFLSDTLPVLRKASLY